MTQMQALERRYNISIGSITEASTYESVLQEVNRAVEASLISNP